MAERRFELRLQRAESVDLTWKDAAGQTHRWTARLMDISVAGAGFFTQRPVPVGRTVHFVYQNHKLTGIVKHCVVAKPGYVWGIEFQPGSQWPATNSRPLQQHV